VIVKYRRFNNTTFLRCIDRDKTIVVKLYTDGKPSRSYLRILCLWYFSKLETKNI